MAACVTEKIKALIVKCQGHAAAYAAAVRLAAPAAEAVVASNRDNNARAEADAPAQRAKDTEERGQQWSRTDLWRLNPGEYDTGPQRNPGYVGSRFKEGSNAQLRLMRACLDVDGRRGHFEWSGI